MEKAKALAKVAPEEEKGQVVAKAVLAEARVAQARVEVVEMPGEAAVAANEARS